MKKNHFLHHTFIAFFWGLCLWTNKTNAQIDSSSVFYLADTLVVKAHPLSNQFSLKHNSVYISREAKELAGTFDDPSRVLYRHTGISTANDQANGIVYHGLPSDLVKWTIHGAEIINPNHLSNAGTISDLASPSAGGVLAIPFDVINNFSFHANAHTENYPSALGGVSNFDFNARGDDFFKVGLLGMEYALQSKRKRNPVKMHLRYSTVGILSQLGVDFGGEAILFTDGFFQVGLTPHINFVSGIGYSSNKHTSIEVIEEAEVQKDLTDIDYNSLLAYAGLVFTKKNFKQTFMYSQKFDERTCDSEIFGDCPNTESNQLKLSYAGDFRLLHNNTHKLDALLNINVLNAFFQSPFGNYDDLDGIIFPSLRYRWFNDQYSFSAKVGPMLDFINNELSIEPSIIATRQFSTASLEFNASINSQAQSIELLGIYAAGATSTNPILLNRNKISNLSLAFKKEIGSDIKIMARTFHHYLFNVPVTEAGFSPVFNGNNYLNALDFTADGIGSNYGLELFYDHDLNNDFYFNTNVTFFNFQYGTKESGMIYDASNNFKFIFNSSISKSIKLDRNRSLSANIAFHYRGGAIQYQEANALAPIALNDYYRVDARVQYEYKKSILSLDIQNLTNHRNDGFYYMDALLQRQVLQQQLGLIPVFSWKRLLS